MPKQKERLSIGFLFDDTLDSNDGVAQYVKTLGAWLGAQGHDVSYLVGQSKTTKWHGGKVYSLSRNLRISWNGNRLSISLLPKLAEIRNLLDDKYFDVLHVQVPYSPFMAQQVINRASNATAVVGTFHVFPANRLSRSGSKILRLIYGKSLKRFNRQISVSSAARSFAKESFGIESEVIPNPVDLKKFAVNRPASDDGEPRRIVFLGRLVKRKGCKQLIEAFRLLAHDMPQVQLIIAGDGPDRQKLQRLVKKLGLKDKVSFLGYLSEEDKAPLLAGADIACFPSLYGESFGIVLIEAMAAGSGVVVGGDNPGYASVLGDQPKLLIDPSDSQSFAERLGELLQDRSLAGELHHWQNKAVGRYDIDSVGKKILDCYYSAIAKLATSGHNNRHAN